MCNSAKLRLEVSVVCVCVCVCVFVCVCVRALMSFLQEKDTCHGRRHFSSYCAVQVSACGSAISLCLVLWLHVACDDNIIPLL